MQSGTRTNTHIGYKLVLGAELATGNLTVSLHYQITATEVDHFYGGCAVDDFFTAAGATALDAANKVKQVIFRG